MKAKSKKPLWIFLLAARKVIPMPNMANNAESPLMPICQTRFPHLMPEANAGVEQVVV